MTDQHIHWSEPVEGVHYATTSLLLSDKRRRAAIVTDYESFSELALCKGDKPIWHIKYPNTDAAKAAGERYLREAN